MDIYDNNPYIGFLKPEMYNLFRWLWRTNESFRAKYPIVDSINHCCLIDIFPDSQRVRIISQNVCSIECLEDQLEDVKQAKILTVHVQGNKESIRIDNTLTKLVLVIGNVQNIELTVDCPETIVFHRVFDFGDECGLVVNDVFDGLKPAYTCFRENCCYPEVFSKVVEYGIGFVDESNRSGLLSGNGWRYLQDTKNLLNCFKDAKIVAIRNNSELDPELGGMKNSLLVFGQPATFRKLEDIKPSVSNAQAGLLLADMSQEAVNCFLENSSVKGFDYFSRNGREVMEGFSVFSDYGKGISPCRHLLRQVNLSGDILDEIVYKVDNPFTFAYVKRRKTDGYRLLTYGVLKAIGAGNDHNLASEKLKVVLACPREKTIDAFHRDRYLELKKANCPEAPFQRELPRIDAFSAKRLAILKASSEQTADIDSLFADQRKNFVLRQSGVYEFSNLYNVRVWNEGTLKSEERNVVDLYFRDCGLVFVYNKESSLACRIHIVGKVHTLLCSPSCHVVCYFVHEKSSFTDYLVCSEKTEEVGMYPLEIDRKALSADFKNSLRPDLSAKNEIAINVKPPKPSLTRVCNLFCNVDNLSGASLAHIDNLVHVRES